MSTRLVQLGSAVVLGITTLDAHAQGRLPEVDGRFLRGGTDSLAIYVVRDGDTTRTGMLWDELAAAELEGRGVLRRVYRTEDRILGARLDTIVDEFPSLAPIQSVSASRHGAEVLSFTRNRVRGWKQLVNGDSVPIDVALPATVYNSATFDLVLRAASLRDGWQAAVPAFLGNTRTVVTLTAKVAGTERIGSSVCWRVDAEFAGMPVTFWIDQSSRKLCKQVMQVSPGVQILFAPARPEPSAKRVS
jgi:hypothetical protein